MGRLSLFVLTIICSGGARAIELDGGVKKLPELVVVRPDAAVKIGAIEQTAGLQNQIPTTIVSGEAIKTPDSIPLPQPLAALDSAKTPAIQISAPKSEPEIRATLQTAVQKNISGGVLFDNDKAAGEVVDPNADAVSASFQDVMLGVFDADDNLWLNANGIWVFKKGSNRTEKVRIPSEEFAHVRQNVGKSGKYADYEFWDDQRQGSFWEFYSQPGRNVLLENLKRMVATRKPEEWQGKSWPAFRAMLQANPKGVHILSASGVSRKDFIEALRFLVSEGHLPDVPPEANIQCVGNPDHPFYASTGSPSKAKLLTMKRLILDPAQKRAEQLKAQGKRPPLLLGPDGVTMQNLMPVGFSDDDPGNISAMKDGAGGEPGLAADYAAGKWPDVKISLFDSDPEDPKAVNNVIKRDGTLRLRTAADDALELR